MLVVNRRVGRMSAYNVGTIARPAEANATHFGIFWSLFRPRRFVCSHRSPRRELSKNGTTARQQHDKDAPRKSRSGGWKIRENM